MGWETRRRSDLAVVMVLAAIPGTLAFLIFGAIFTPDTPSYLVLAEQIAEGALVRGHALLQQGPTPLSLYRTPGFPMVLLGLQNASPEGWSTVLVLVQILSQSILAAVALRTALLCGLGRRAAFFAALAPATGFAMVGQAMVMTDALYGALFSIAALLLVQAGVSARRPLVTIAVAGLLMGFAATIREATPYLVLFMLPAAAIAAGRRRRILGVATMALPVMVSCAAIMTDRWVRSGHAMLSTSRQVVMVQATLPALKRGVAIFHGEDVFDRTVRETVGRHGYAAMAELQQRLFDQGMTAPEMAATATSRYWRAWREHPVEMLRGVAIRLPVKMFWMAFMPVDAWAELHIRTDRGRPWFQREQILLRDLRDGSPLAGLLLMALGASRAIGLLLGIAAILAPVLLSRQDPRWWPLLGAWLICVGGFAVYAPVHIEQRYLIPIVPLISLLGVIGTQAALRAVPWRVGRRVAAA